MASRFDEFSKALAQQHSRRGVLRVAAGAALGGALAWLGRPETAEQATLVEQANPCPPSLRQHCRQLRAQREQAFDLETRSEHELKRLQDEQKTIQANIANAQGCIASYPPSSPQYRACQAALARAQADLATNQGRQTATQGVIDGAKAQVKQLDDEYDKANCYCCVEGDASALLGLADYAGPAGALSQIPGRCCPAGQTPCGQVCCTSTQCCQNGTCLSYSQQSAGACGTGGAACAPCAPDQACQNGVCTAICNATACPNGCCSSNTCLPYTSQSPLACGTGGTTCQPCANGQTCQGGACVCTATSCEAGCCSSGLCFPYSGQSSSFCGTGGATCAACPANASCVNGACTCNSGFTACNNSNGQLTACCASGQNCVNGACQGCNAQSCPNGCCSGTACIPYADQSKGSCGTGGAACMSCGAGTCQNGTCTGCSSTSCPNGCCDSNGVCQPGTSNSACGSLGGTCGVCPANSYCTQWGYCCPTNPPSGFYECCGSQAASECSTICTGCNAAGCCTGCPGGVTICPAGLAP